MTAPWKLIGSIYGNRMWYVGDRSTKTTIGRITRDGRGKWKAVTRAEVTVAKDLEREEAAQALYDYCVAVLPLHRSISGP